MTLEQIKNRVMFQTNNDEEDVGDYLPHLVDYINDGYDRLVDAWANQHIGVTNWPVLSQDTDTPLTPEWTHMYLADWATWLVYRNGNPQKQQRGYAFMNSFEEMLKKARLEGGADGVNTDGTRRSYQFFINIPR